MKMAAKEVVDVKENDVKALEFIEEVTTNCDAVQEHVLAEILGRNSETEYLKRHHLEGRTDRDTFKSRVPVVTYEDIQPDIRRIANDDFSPILTSEPISEFFTRYYPGMDKGKSLCFLFTRAETRTPGGLVAQPSFTGYYKHNHFNRGLDPYIPYTSLTESIFSLDSFQSMYSQMLCGLYERLQVIRIRALFASGLVRAIYFLHLHYNDLCHDIATGTLSPKITDPTIQRAMSKIMNPDSDLARTIQQECSRKNWEVGIIQRIWPNTKYLDTIVTGSMAQYIPTLDLYRGGLPIVSTSYRSAECYLGLNLNPIVDPYDVTYTIMPNTGYFEFIPLETSSSNPTLVDLANVELGKDYELVITTYNGLYRYRMGDIVRATSFHNAAPEFRFIRRKNVLLSIDADKTDESELQKAVDSASLLLRQRSNAYIVEYTSYADTKTIPGHYIIYIELMMLDNVNEKWLADELLESCCLEMEESLNSVYRQCRFTDGSVGPLEIRVVRHGTFERVTNYVVTRGASINQYKMSRCISLLPIVELLDSGVVSAHFSPTLPPLNHDIDGGHVRV